MKPFNRKEVYYKVTNQEENHNGLQYHTGRVVDPLPFNDNPKASCVPGGIYFTDKDHLLRFGDYGPWVRPLTIPAGVKVVLDPDGDKFRAHEVEMIDRIPMEEFLKTVDMGGQGSVYLGSLTTLPDGARFENKGGVYLSSLTSLPEGARFENKGDVYLISLTTLPEDVRFKNKGYVDLSSLTTLPEGVSFENQGYVSLSSLTTLPEDVRFENKGDVSLSSLTTLPEGARFGKGVQKVYLNRATTDEELGRMSKKHNIEFLRW